MLEEPQHGMHYLVDFYAFLGVERNADEAMIAAALRAKTIEYTDPPLRLSLDLRTQAEEKMKVVNLARETLTHESKRAEYDKQLAEWDGPISSHGFPVIDLSTPHFSTTSLLSGITEDPDIARRRVELVNQLSGHDPQTFSLLERLYQENKNPPEDLEAAYRDALRKRDIYIEMQSHFTWETMGYYNRPSDTQLTSDHVNSTEKELTAASNQIQADVEKKIALIQGGEAKALGPSGEDITQDIISDSDNALARYQEIVTERFRIGAEKILEIAREREQIIEKRMGVIEYRYWPEQTEMFPHLLICIETTEKQLWMAFALVDEDQVTSDDSVDEEDLAALADSQEKAEQWIKRGYNILLFKAEDNLNYQEQVKKIVTLHFEQLPD